MTRSFYLIDHLPLVVRAGLHGFRHILCLLHLSSEKSYVTAVEVPAEGEG